MPRAGTKHKSSTPPEWKEWEKKLLMCDVETQKALDQFYINQNHHEHLRFEPGDGIISLSLGVYHQAKIWKYHEAVIPDTLREHFQAKYPDKTLKNVADVPPEERIPSAIVSFDGWGPKWNEKVPENELISRTPSELCHVQGILFAHEWNTFERTKKNLSERDLGKTAWFLDDETYVMLDNKWKRLTGNSVSYPEYCGRAGAMVSAEEHDNTEADAE